MSASVSDLLGYACIGCWLGAQFPQILENARRRSCDGLAFPLLANWFLGDFSNLIGCILTHQLPFQTWLATYFVSVDLILVAQYIYYYRSLPPPRHRPSRRSTAIAPTPRYRTLSVAASHVATSAALVAHHDGQPDASRHSAHWYRASHDQLHSATYSQDQNTHDDDDPYAAMADSFHSEGPRTLGRHSISWSRDRYDRRGASVGRHPHHTVRSAIGPHMRMTPSLLPDSTTTRGRSLARDADLDDPQMPDHQRQPSRASRLASASVFLAVFALFSLGPIPHSARVPSFVTNVGRVLVPRSDPALLAEWNAPVVHPLDQFLHDNQPPSHDPSIPGHMDERVLGRIFAWLCTTLYLTSRMPQIWKNFTRKSVEGLSIFLFLFAFLGNSFYVASILTNPLFYAPPPVSTNFIKESIPFILGSGGTLMFDVTILTQTYIYRPKPRRARAQSRFADERRLLSEDFAPAASTESINRSRGRMSSVHRTTS